MTEKFAFGQNQNNQLTFVILLRKDQKLLKICMEVKWSNWDDNEYGDNCLKYLCFGKIKTISWLLLFYSEAAPRPNLPAARFARFTAWNSHRETSRSLTTDLWGWIEAAAWNSLILSREVFRVSSSSGRRSWIDLAIDLCQRLFSTVK